MISFSVSVLHFQGEFFKFDSFGSIKKAECGDYIQNYIIQCTLWCGAQCGVIIFSLAERLYALSQSTLYALFALCKKV